MTTHVITFDTDWAPDYMIEECYSLCKYYNVSATFFFTNPSETADTIRNDPHYEIGIHPNFFQNTTQLLDSYSKERERKIFENDFERYAAVLDYCNFFFPDAIGMRTHALYKSTYLYSYIVENYKNIQYDASTLIPSDLICRPWQEWYPFFHNPNILGKLIFIPFSWEDDKWFSFQNKQLSIGSTQTKSSSIIYNFHPVHVYLNTMNMAHYNSAKKHIKNIKEIKKYRNDKEKGVRDYLISLLEVKQYKTDTVKDIWRKYEHCNHR